MELQINSVDQMHQLGAKIGAQLKAGDVVVLTGELGSGKTVLTQGIASSFGIKNITSPTFVISRVYKSKINFIHIDTYRLLDQGVSSFSDLDFESYLENSIFVIEWGASFVNTLTDQYLEIIIKQGTEESFRNISFNLVGDRWSGFNL
ncbi:MAG TPA: tRNA (adenosine(37)-N6)-threonylcarbamoyltransferase complex ATPase subunit type 1 TsaE [Candidatus Nanopelagicus sp.]|jgi:tRNA threonylcarbamoyladenosine biosynthesis protein TsaE|uniref:tRNA threonylcarbamoyladenosine biosynthesis protein TsaE n=1 Tax=freshwater metagenome TaxID=449393 RepID=A0A6J7R342_9ZZZZ|nr:tRNA (adenosine(37)-N6)-threonylcarbamoyltransferase complex ATPase subunit type 1 TsaE [Actinomycetota bacterium]HRD21608.1 tRNA (adenosine(37)-N6)-threonylcarbamoyltransferase complex ATPase subunit type 1 TsaE [Candidatus Nanopelagicus sp.]